MLFSPKQRAECKAKEHGCLPRRLLKTLKTDVTLLQHWQMREHKV
jgi:hypothetical protein